MNIHIWELLKHNMKIGVGINILFVVCILYIQYRSSLYSLFHYIGSSPYSIPKSTPPGDHTLTVTAKALGSVLSSSETTFHVEDKQILTATVDVKKCGALLNIQLNQSDIICLCYLDNKENGENCKSTHILHLQAHMASDCTGAGHCYGVCITDVYSRTSL